MGIFSDKYGLGVFCLHSDSDPRWRVQEEVNTFSILLADDWRDNKLEELKQEFGEPPDDLQFFGSRY